MSCRADTGPRRAQFAHEVAVINEPLKLRSSQVKFLLK